MDSRRGPCQVSRVQSGSPPPAGGGAGASGALQALRNSVVEGGGGAASVHEKEDHQRQPQSSCVASSMKTQKNLPKTVHPQLRVHLSRALARMCNTFLVDRRVLDECLCEISEALLKADFPTEMVSELRLKVKKAMDPTVSGCNQSIHQVVSLNPSLMYYKTDLVAELRSLILVLQVLCKEICKLIDSGRKPSFVPKKGKPCIVLVIGLQGCILNHFPASYILVTWVISIIFQKISCCPHLVLFLMSSSLRSFCRICAPKTFILGIYQISLLPY